MKNTKLLTCYAVIAMIPKLSITVITTVTLKRASFKSNSIPVSLPAAMF